MSKLILHASFVKPNAFGGFKTGTLCGREQLQADGMNIGEATVTCKICLKMQRQRSVPAPRPEPPDWRGLCWSNGQPATEVIQWFERYRQNQPAPAVDMEELKEKLATLIPCHTAACKNARHGAKDWECEGCSLRGKVIALLQSEISAAVGAAVERR
jgi:hypothetical protein